MDTNLKTLRPWPEIYRDLSRMTSMKVVVDGVTYEGEAQFELSEDRVLTLTVSGAAKPTPKARAKK